MRSARITTAAAVAVALFALAGCSTSPPQVVASAEPSLIASEVPADGDGRTMVHLGDGVSVAVLPSECTPVLIGEGRLLGTIVDHGDKTYANGSVIHNDTGEIRAYEVTSGDTLIGIGERFCMSSTHIYYANDLNKTGAGIHPGDVLILDPTR